MEGHSFVQELIRQNQGALLGIEQLGASLPVTQEPDFPSLLRLALANEISVAELAAFWMPTTREWDVKVAMACQAGDEARHFAAIEGRLRELGLGLDSFSPPPSNPLFDYLKSLNTTVERVAAGMVTLEAIAFRVNEQFLRQCEKRGDQKTVEIYERYIQPDEQRHHQRGVELLEKYAVTAADQEKARVASERTLEISRTLRTAAALRLGTACFPGC